MVGVGNIDYFVSVMVWNSHWILNTDFTMKEVNIPLNMYLSMSLYWLFKLTSLVSGNCRFKCSHEEKTEIPQTFHSFSPVATSYMHNDSAVITAVALEKLATLFRIYKLNIHSFVCVFSSVMSYHICKFSNYHPS